MDEHTISLIIRWIHVCSMAFMLGSALLLLALAIKPQASEPGEQARLLLSVARRFELLFWVAIGIQVMTGVGNLGAFGTSLPAPDSVWGGKFIIKISIFILLLLLSVVRTLFVVHLSAAASGLNEAQVTRLSRGIYGSTGLTLAVIVFLAVSLAH